MYNYPHPEFKTVFSWRNRKSRRKNKEVKAELIGYVPEWVTNIHFNFTSLRVCVPTNFKGIEAGKKYKVRLRKATVGSKRCSVDILKESDNAS